MVELLIQVMCDGSLGDYVQKGRYVAETCSGSEAGPCLIHRCVHETQNRKGSRGLST